MKNDCCNTKPCCKACRQLGAYEEAGYVERHRKRSPQTGESRANENKPVERGETA